MTASLAEKGLATQADRELGLPGIVELALGYQRAQVLFAANDVGVFEILAAAGGTAADVAARLHVHVRGARALLDACVALRLLRRVDGRYENSRTARLFLLANSEASFAPVLRFWQRYSYGPWGRLVNAVVENRPQAASGPKPGDLFDRLMEDEEQLRLFFDGLTGLARWPARKLADTVDFSRYRHLLDIGGGSGVYSEVIGRSYPDLRITLFDLDPVCALARQRFSAVDPTGRLRAVAGDFHRDPLPAGVDCALLCNVLHDWSEEECVALLGRTYQALSSGGQVIVVDFVPTAVHESVEASLMCLALLVDTCRGRVYAQDEVRTWLGTCGFRQVRQEALTGGMHIVFGTKEP